MSRKDIHDNAKQSEKSLSRRNILLARSKRCYKRSRAALIGATALMSVAMFDPAQAQAPSPQRPNC